VVIYVSSSLGDDGDTGGIADPVATIAKALTLVRDGYPDQILLKCGDTWSETLEDWDLSGQDATHRFVVATYGSGDRPILECGTNAAVTRGANVHDVAFVGLDFYADTRDRTVPGYSNNGADGGIYWLGSATRLLFEDCVIRWFKGNAIQGYPTTSDVVAGISFRRCMFLDMWCSDAHSQGLYMGYPGDGTSGGPTDILIEECLFDGCGWASDASLRSAFNHSIYLNNACGLDDAIVRKNIILRSSSHAMQVRAGGSTTDNLCVSNAIGIQVGIGDDPNPGGVTGTITDNVILDGEDIGATPLAFGIVGGNISTLSATGNIIAHDLSADPYGRGFDLGDSIGTVSDNIVYDWRNPVQHYGVPDDIEYSSNEFQEVAAGEALVWLDSTQGGATFVGNNYYSPSLQWYVNGSVLDQSDWELIDTTGTFVERAYVNPDISLADVLGVADTAAAAALLRSRGRGEWDTDQTAVAINAVIRAGFVY
jgi:hypothetical protein